MCTLHAAAASRPERAVQDCTVTPGLCSAHTPLSQVCRPATHMGSHLHARDAARRTARPSALSATSGCWLCSRRHDDRDERGGRDSRHDDRDRRPRDRDGEGRGGRGGAGNDDRRRDDDRDRPRARDGDDSRKRWVGQRACGCAFGGECMRAWCVRACVHVRVCVCVLRSLRDKAITGTPRGLLHYQCAAPDRHIPVMRSQTYAPAVLCGALPPPSHGRTLAPLPFSPPSLPYPRSAGHARTRAGGPGSRCGRRRPLRPSPHPQRSPLCASRRP